MCQYRWDKWHWQKLDVETVNSDSKQTQSSSQWPRSAKHYILGQIQNVFLCSTIVECCPNVTELTLTRHFRRWLSIMLLAGHHVKRRFDRPLAEEWGIPASEAVNSFFCARCGRRCAVVRYSSSLRSTTPAIRYRASSFGHLWNEVRLPDCSTIWQGLKCSGTFFSLDGTSCDTSDHN